MHAVAARQLWEYSGNESVHDVEFDTLHAPESSTELDEIYRRELFEVQVGA